MTDILDQQDIKTMVDTFYHAVRQDPTLGPIFDQRIEDRWPEHLAKMYNFWSSMLLGTHSYHGHPFAPHATLPISEEHFTIWLTIFDESLNRQYRGPVAGQARLRAKFMATMFVQRLSTHQKQRAFRTP